MNVPFVAPVTANEIVFAPALSATSPTTLSVYDTPSVYVNVVLYTVCGIVLQSWILPLYSIVTYAAALKTVDYIIEGVDRSKALMIVTANAKPVCAMLSQAFEEGITVISAKGYYSDSDKNLVYVVLNRFQISRAQEIVHTADKDAYISIIDVADVFKSAHTQDAEKKLIEPKNIKKKIKRRLRIKRSVK